MKAVEISEFGGPQVLRLVDREPPTAQAGELLIQVYAAGVNRPDVLQRKGYYPPPPGASDLPGLEVAGVVSGGDLSSGPFELGDPVCALLTGGGYAQAVAAPIGQVLPMPRGLSFVEAAGLPEAFFTVWSNLVDRAHLVRGESLLVHGGTSGIGVVAIGLAVARGATVLATAGTDEKCRVCESLGARSGINYRSEDFSERVLALTDGRGVDVVLDMVAGDYVARDLKCMAPDGRLVLIATQGGAQAQFDAGVLLRQRLTITGSTLRARTPAFKAAIARALLREVWPLIEAGRIKPMCFASFDLASAAAAHALMEEGAHIGKIILTVDPRASERVRSGVGVS